MVKCWVWLWWHQRLMVITSVLKGIFGVCIGERRSPRRLYSAHEALHSLGRHPVSLDVRPYFLPHARPASCPNYKIARSPHCPNSRHMISQEAQPQLPLVSAVVTTASGRQHCRSCCHCCHKKWVVFFFFFFFLVFFLWFLFFNFSNAEVFIIFNF